MAARTKSGHGESGDQYAVFPDSSGVLIAVVDGLGHGRGGRRDPQQAPSVLGGGLDLIGFASACNL